MAARLSLAIRQRSQLLSYIPVFGRCHLQIRSLKIGDALPSVDLYEHSPTDAVNIRDLFKGRRGILFSVLGAFTPACTEVHLPEYLSHNDKFKEEGYDLICCVAVNDPFVMAAWGEQVAAEGKIRMLADPRAEFTKALKMDVDCRHVLGNVRSKRYSIVVEDGVINGINTEPDHTGLACLLCIKNYKSKLK